MPTAEYYIRLTPSGDYGVTKFLGGKEPAASYVVRKLTRPAGRLKCDCQGFKFHNTCRHIPLVAQFINQGERMPFVIRHEE
jgi:hypothetical protein